MNIFNHYKLVPSALVVALITAILFQYQISWLSPKGTLAQISTRDSDSIMAAVSGDYSGQATLQGVYNGVWSSKSTIADKDKIDLGYIDLAFNLAPTTGGVAGNVILSRTLVYSATNGNISITGQMIGNSWHITSTEFTMKMNEARMIGDEQVAPERVVTRQFSLDTEQILNDGATLLGTYRETIWGYAPEPVTVVGKFALERPVFGTTASLAQRRVFLPLVRR